MVEVTGERAAEVAAARAADERIAQAWDAYWIVEGRVREARTKIRDAQKAINMGYDSPYRRETIAKAEALIEAERPALEAARAEAVALDQELYTGWTRFFLVQHIHNTQHCQSFRPTTRVGWLPSVSGLTEAEAVAEHGATLCTICFPTAPVALTTKPVDENQCPGTGRMYNADKLTGRERAYYSPTGTCPECGEVVGLTARNSVKIRKHKKGGV